VQPGNKVKAKRRESALAVGVIALCSQPKDSLEKKLRIKTLHIDLVDTYQKHRHYKLCQSVPLGREVVLGWLSCLSPPRSARGSMQPQKDR
jgi:hypothetical protein